MCISKQYASKGWPTFEKNVAVMRQINERSEYILPIAFDETRIDGLDPSIKYVSADKYSPIQLAALIKVKVHGSRFQSESSDLPLLEPNSPLDKLRKLNEAGQQRELKRNFLNSEEGIVTALNQAKSLVNGFDDWINEVEGSVQRYFLKAKTHDHGKLVIGYEVFSVLIEFYQKARNTTTNSFLVIGFYYGTYNLSSNSFSSPRRMDERMK